MSKVLKVGGIAILVLLAAYGVVSFFSQTFVGSGTKSMGGNYSGIEGKGMGLSDSMPVANNSVRTGKMAATPSAAPSAVSSYQAESSGDVSPVQSDKKIVKNGNLNLKVDNADESVKKISDIAKGNGGEVFSSNFYQSANNVKSGIVTVKVPVANFENTFEQIKKVATLVIRESTSGQDVTEEYVDLKAQLTNRQAEEQAYVRILDQAQKIDDILAVTSELSNVRGEIEQLQGQIKYLESQTDMSTITANLTEDQNITVVDSWRPLQVVKDSFNALIKGLQGFVDWVIRFIITVLPLLLIWAIIIWALYVVGRKIYLKMKKTGAND